MDYKSTADYAKISLDDTYTYLKSSPDGLSTKDATERLTQYGQNSIDEKKENKLLAFLKRYWGPMPWLLEFSIALTAFIGHYTESIIIFALLTINAVIGYMQSNSSQKAVSLMQSSLKKQANVYRDGKWSTVDSSQLAIGDVFNLKMGEIVPADARVIDGTASVDDSALTGESQQKDITVSGIVYSGAIIKHGEVKCIVLNTGAKTYFGKTVELVKAAKPKSKQQEVMLTIVKYLLYLGILISAIVGGYALYLKQDVISIVTLVVVFLIACVPVALPAVLTIVQAYGASELSKKGVLVTKLDSIEDASSIDVFCFDKTGTITQNVLSVVDVTSFGEYSKEAVIQLGVSASQEDGMDTIDLAVIHYGQAQKIDQSNYQQISYTPFDSLSKKTQAQVNVSGKEITVIKGAVETILALCTQKPDNFTKNVDTITDSYSQKGYKTIAVAATTGQTTAMAGIIAIADPPRPDSAEMIAKIQKSGIRCLMLTGDSVPIAKQIGGQVGIGSNIQPVGTLKGKSKEDQYKLVTQCNGFAEVYPEDKYDVVKLLQDNGHLVGMTGDGVNDAPALKQAELGTAVSGATDVARASAAIVLTNKGLGEIVDAIKLSRETYQRMLTWVLNKIIKVVEIFIVLAIGFFATHSLILSILGMSLLVFANDFATMSIATDNVRATDAPDKWSIKRITASAVILGSLYAILDLALLFAGKQFFHLAVNEISTLVLLCLVFNSQFTILTVRERNHFWNTKPSKQLLLVSFGIIVLFSILGVLGILITPLPFYIVLSLLLVCFLFSIVLDPLKCIILKFFKV